MGKSGIRGHLGVPRRVGVFGAIRGCRGIRGVGVLGLHWGWQVDWEPDHIGPQSRVPALPLVPLGE